MPVVTSSVQRPYSSRWMSIRGKPAFRIFSCVLGRSKGMRKYSTVRWPESKMAKRRANRHRGVARSNPGSPDSGPGPPRESENQAVFLPWQADGLKAAPGRNHESALIVRVAKANGLSFRALEQGERLARSEDVLIFVERRAVNNLKTVQLHRAGGKRAKETEMLGRELIPSPLDGKSSQGIEFCGIGVA